MKPTRVFSILSQGIWKQFVKLPIHTYIHYKPWDEMTWQAICQAFSRLFSRSSSSKHLTDLFLIPAWISSCTHYKLLHSCTVEVWEWTSNFILQFIGFVNNYPCLLSGISSSYLRRGWLISTNQLSGTTGGKGQTPRRCALLGRHCTPRRYTITQVFPQHRVVYQTATICPSRRIS